MPQRKTLTFSITDPPYEASGELNPCSESWRGGASTSSSSTGATSEDGAAIPSKHWSPARSCSWW